jgi:hypothetical protein
MSMNKKPGRPKKRPDQSKTSWLDVRLEALEKQAFVEAAQIAGIPLASWVRERLRRVAVRELEEAGRPIAFLQNTVIG